MLHWNATRLLALMATRAGDSATAAEMHGRATTIKASADRELWDETQGVFRASTGVGRDNIDVWGNALAGAVGFASAAQVRSRAKPTRPEQQPPCTHTGLRAANSNLPVIDRHAASAES